MMATKPLFVELGELRGRLMLHVSAMRIEHPNLARLALELDAAIEAELFKSYADETRAHYLRPDELPEVKP